MARKSKADWAVLRAEYVNGAMSLRELADAHGVNVPGVLARASREGWDSERKQMQSNVISKALAVSSEKRAEQLAKFNEQDAKIAEALKSKAVKILHAADDEKTLSALSKVFEAAQRIGRLALGATTENTESVVMTRELPASVDEFV